MKSIKLQNNRGGVSDAVVWCLYSTKASKWICFKKKSNPDYVFLIKAYTLSLFVLKNECSICLFPLNRQYLHLTLFTGVQRDLQYLHLTVFTGIPRNTLLFVNVKHISCAQLPFIFAQNNKQFTAKSNVKPKKINEVKRTDWHKSI